MGNAVDTPVSSPLSEISASTPNQRIQRWLESIWLTVVAAR